MGSDGPTVFVVDDDKDMLNSVAVLLRSVNIAARTFNNAQDFLTFYEPEYSGCLVLDVRMPGMSGLELQSVLTARRIELPVIFITGYGDVPTAVRALKQGALDFLEKPFNCQVLLEIVQQALALDARRRLLRIEQAHRAKRFEVLTERERQVMELIVAGNANKVIAVKLGLSQKTVEFHRAKVMEKTRATSTAELVRFWVTTEQLRESTRAGKGISPYTGSSFYPMTEA
jgi:two-component system, LuxR family, response regulator FixJ